MKRQGLTLEVIWFDDDVLELLVIAESSHFRAAVQAYCGHGHLSDIADSIVDFPASIHDRRQFTLGAFGPNYAGGAASVDLIVQDNAGHCGALVQLEADHRAGTPVESAVVMFRTEPSDIDEFVPALRRLDQDRSGIAKLQARE